MTRAGKGGEEETKDGVWGRRGWRVEKIRQTQRCKMRSFYKEEMDQRLAKEDCSLR